MTQDLKNKAEAVLFASGGSIAAEEIAKLCRYKNLDEIKEALRELKSDYEQKDSSLFLIEEGQKWKLTVREAYMPVAKRIIADTELPKSIIETMAVVAWKQPIKQSEIIKIRGNKGYDHLNAIEELGFITRQKHGRTNLIKLTEKFFKYFELSGNKDIREMFKNVKKEEPSQKKVEEFVDEEEKLGKLEVYDEPKEESEEPTQDKEIIEKGEEKMEEEPKKDAEEEVKETTEDTAEETKTTEEKPAEEETTTEEPKAEEEKPADDAEKSDDTEKEKTD